jgi:phage terminase large subunit GpA-like protein
MTPQLEMNAPDVGAIIERAARNGARPEGKRTVSEWADEFRMLTTRSSPEPGRWRTSRTPYLKQVMDCLSPSDAAEIVVLMSGSQVGKTEAGNNWIGYSIHLAPGPMMAVQPTTELAQRNSKQRIAPLIEDCPALRSRVKESRSRDSGNTVLAKEFPGGILVMVGANSAKGLRSMPARYLFLDEVDTYPGDVDGEGEPCDLAIARTSNFPRRKIFITSTPVVSGRSRIERYFNQSDQNHFFVPCPLCGEMQTLRPEFFHYSKLDPSDAHFVCEFCEGRIENHHKNWMLPRGEWRPQAETPQRRIRGFYLPTFYAPVGWISWEQIARKHLEAETDPAKMQVYHNLILGIPWADVGEVPNAARLYERREIYPIGIVPLGGLVLTAGVDVQLRRLEVEIVAWGRNRESWSVDYRVIEGDTSQEPVWGQLEQLLDEDFPSEYGQPMRIQKAAVDSGFNTLAVYNFVRLMNPIRVMAVKGDNHAASLVGHPSLIEIGPHGQRLKAGIRLWPLNVGIGKEQFYRWLRTDMPDLDSGEPWPVGFCHFPQYSREFFEQLCAEQLMTKTVLGYRKTEWVKMRERNEALDCRIYALAAAGALRVDTWQPDKWNSIERSLTVTRITRVQKNVAKPQLGATYRSSSGGVPEFKPFHSDDSFSED